MNLSVCVDIEMIAVAIKINYHERSGNLVLATHHQSAHGRAGRGAGAHRLPRDLCDRTGDDQRPRGARLAGARTAGS